MKFFSSLAKPQRMTRTVIWLQLFVVTDVVRVVNETLMT